jgi:hypothetical protein
MVNQNLNRHQKVYEPKTLSPDDISFLLSIQNMTLKEIEGLLANTAEGDSRFQPYDIFTLPKDKFYNKESIKTTVGRYIFNKVVLSETLGKILGYINKTMDGGGIGWLDGTISDLLLRDEISSDEVSNYIDKMQWLGFSTSKFLNASLTTSLVTTLPAVAERRDELFKRHEEAIKNGDVEVTAKIEKELLDLAANELKDDPAMEIYRSGARGKFNNNYKQVAVIR